jgi:D-lactate dehydrogenase
VRLVAARATGLDNIDTRYCQGHGIQVVNVPSYGTNTVAEHTFALLLAISHRLVDGVERTRRGEFSPIGLQGFDLLGKTLGVVGTGHIGSWVIRLARGFGMEVLAFDPHPNGAFAGEPHIAYVGLDQLLRQSDVVTLHVPLTESTRNLIGRGQIQAMKDGAVLLNTARGELVDAPALVEALVSGKLRAAGLDVLAEEPALRDEPELLRQAFHEQHDLRPVLAEQLLMRMPNVLVTPHSAFNTKEALQRILDTTIRNIVAYVRGEARDLAGGAAAPAPA